MVTVCLTESQSMIVPIILFSKVARTKWDLVNRFIIIITRSSLVFKYNLFMTGLGSWSYIFLLICCFCSLFSQKLDILKWNSAYRFIQKCVIKFDFGCIEAILRIVMPFWMGKIPRFCSLSMFLLLFTKVGGRSVSKIYFVTGNSKSLNM